MKTYNEFMVGPSFKGLYVIIIKTFLYGEHIYSKQHDILP